MIEIKNLTLQRGLKVLLNQATATINPRQRVGLIGKMVRANPVYLR